VSNTEQRRPQLDIRKYPNRRYYDATHSRHLTLEEIRGLVRDGHDIKVTDSKTGADITAQLLTQIILELETPKLESFPVNMLVQMIRANERVVGDFITKYFTQAFDAYVQYQAQMEEQFRHLHAMPGGVVNPFAAWSKAVFNPFVAAGAAADQAPSEADKQQHGDSEIRAAIDALQQQLHDLREQLKTAKKGPRKPRKK